MMSFTIIVFVIFIFAQHVVTTKNYNLILPALIFTIVLTLVIATLSSQKKNNSSTSSAGLNPIVTNTINTGQTSTEEVQTSIPDPIQSGYDIPLM
jgi:competence protein ComGC